MLTRTQALCKRYGVGSQCFGWCLVALVQLAKRRGARVIAIASEAKQKDVTGLGADVILARAPDTLRTGSGDEKVTVVVDVVGGPCWLRLINFLERGGRYTYRGANAGPIVELDLRTSYLHDLTFTGSTVITPEVTSNLISFVENDEIKPVLAAIYRLNQFHEAQAAFISKNCTGRRNSLATLLLHHENYTHTCLQD